MTLDELIQKTQGQSLPVSDRDSKKELRNLNKSIQELVGSMKRDKESTTSDTMKSRMRDMIDKTISQRSDGIKPMTPRLLSNTSKISRKEDAPKADNKLAESISKSNTSLIGEIKKMRTDIAMLKESLTKPQQPGKLVAGSIDPNLSKAQRFDRGLPVSGQGTGGGSGGSLLGGLLGGGAAALAAYMTLSDEEKQKLKEGIRGALDKLINGPVGQMIADTVKQAKETAEKAIGDWLKENGDDIVKDPIAWIKDNPATAAALGLGALAIGRALKTAIKIAAVPLKVAGAGLGMAGAALGGAAAAGTAVGKMIKERMDARKEKIAEGMKKPLPGAATDDASKRVEPTLDKNEQAKVKAEQATQKVIPPTETEEQRAAREKATQRAKADVKQMGEDDTTQRKRRVGLDDIESKKKPSLLDRLKTSGKQAGKTLLKGARFLGPVGAAIGVGMTAYEGVQAATNAEDVLGIEGRDATFTERLAAGVGGLAEGATLGLVSKEDVAKKLAGQEEKRSASRDKVSAAIDRKARQAKTEREISREISMKRLQLEKMAGKDGKISKSDLPEARQLASDIADLNADLRRVRAMPQEQRTYQPSAMLKDASSENRQLTLPAANMAPSPYGHMMQNIQNVFNSSNQTTVSGSAATPKNQSGTIARYLDRLFNAG